MQPVIGVTVAFASMWLSRPTDSFRVSFAWTRSSSFQQPLRIGVSTAGQVAGCLVAMER